MCLGKGWTPVGESAASGASRAILVVLAVALASFLPASCLQPRAGALPELWACALVLRGKRPNSQWLFSRERWAFGWGPRGTWAIGSRVLRK